MSSTRSQLLDDEQAITPKFEQVLLDIFKKYATLRNGASDSIENYVILSEGLERFGRDTNGQPLPEDQLEEMRTFLDCDNEGNLLFKGFMQMYSLQTSSEEEETRKDLRTHGYNEIVLTGDSNDSPKIVGSPEYTSAALSFKAHIGEDVKVINCNATMNMHATGTPYIPDSV